jgi:predicted nuclease with TOPRIM domain
MEMPLNQLDKENLTQINSQVHHLTSLLNEKDNNIQHIKNELHLLNELLQSKKNEYTALITRIQNQLVQKDNVIARLTSESNTVKNEISLLQHGYQASVSELNRIHNLKGVKLLLGAFWLNSRPDWISTYWPFVSVSIFSQIIPCRDKPHIHIFFHALSS